MIPHASKFVMIDDGDLDNDQDDDDDDDDNDDDYDDDDVSADGDPLTKMLNWE